MEIACIAIGSNLGDRVRSLDAAVALIAGLPRVRLLARSRYHETAPVGGPPGQRDYLNGVVVIETELPPLDLLAELQRIESDLGREPQTRRVFQGPRIIDLDLLLVGEAVIDGQDGLTLPHPRMHERRFVLEPLAEVAPGVRHPLLGLSAEELLERLDESGADDEA
ncbi:MAG: 2-amino-4-hydroxy-6-hydroxymethyldihydropteridine pyrophosphokinase [Phycisphaerae bacterium]|nr:2-amino-4-hydroxy-6-hydroxymethyldihydropteridine pyrophosphokinase [Phycisphaerae bacterium]